MDQASRNTFLARVEDILAYCSKLGLSREQTARALASEVETFGFQVIRRKRAPRAKGLTLEKFHNNVSPEPNTGCWLWAGGAGLAPYGSVQRGRTIPAHRYSVELYTGLFPERLYVDHLCSQKACVNPAHLEAVTRNENMRRAYQRGERKLSAYQLRKSKR